MAKQAICDECGEMGELDKAYSTIPNSWYTLRQGYLKPERHLCSLGCLEAAVRGEQAQAVVDAASAAAAAAPPDEGPTF